jgi:hypothetical protein
VGLFDLFGSRQERARGAIRKLARKVTERFGPAENRQKAIEQLAAMGTPEALAVLALRFTVRAEVGITDDEEKAAVRGHLVAAGEKALPPIHEYLERQESGISWGLRVLADLVPAPQVMERVLALLTRAGQEYSRDPEKKLVLLSWLAEHHAPAPSRATAATVPTPEEAAILPLHEDMSDDVRIAATRALARLGVGEPGREGLVKLLLRDADAARVRGEVLQALCDLSADVKGHRPSVEALPLDPFFLDKDGRVKKRG